MRRYFRKTSASKPELAALEITSDDRGAPLCAVPNAPLFSISHCAAGGLCAVGLSGRRVGVDWEMVAPRSRELAQLFSCPGELPPDQDDPRSQTRLWAVKEAILKLLGLGLAASPRDIQTHPWLCLTGRARERWLELGSPTLCPAVTQIDDSVVAIVHTQPRS